jgi:LysM repeat protein
MPGAYKPPLTSRAQAVRTTRRASLQRWRWWWVVPVLGLLPVLVAAVLASEGRFGPPAGGGQAAGTPVSSSPRAQAIAAQPRPTTVAQPQPPAAQPPAAQPTAAGAQPAATAAPAQPVAPQPASQQPAQSSTTESQAAVAETTQASVSNARTTPPRTTGPFQAYRVQPGDTVRLIAQEFGVSTASIAQASGLHNADQLRVGQVLTIPNQTGYLYRIQPGETLDQIAARTGIPTELIVSASKLSDEMVQAGDVILIPERIRPGK